jgi:hypothetical protein
LICRVFPDLFTQFPVHGNNPLGAGVLDRAITLDRTGYPAANPQFIHSYSTASPQQALDSFTSPKWQTPANHMAHRATILN